jgi:hypothetical protein
MYSDFNDFRMDFKTYLKYSQNPGILSIFEHFPQGVSSSDRMTKLFLKSCEKPVEAYTSCIGNSNWKDDIEQYISEDARKSCHSVWNKVASCSTKNLGESYTIKLNLMRRLERTNVDSAVLFDKVLENQKKFIKEHMPSGEDEE